MQRFKEYKKYTFLTGEIHLLKYSEVIGLPVICITTGKKLGVVNDITIDKSSRKIEAIIIENKKNDFSKKAILLDDIENIGSDAVIASKNYKLSSTKDLKGMPFINMKDRAGIYGLKVFSKTGRDMGIVKDVLFDPKTSLVEVVVLSDGLLSDLIRGRNILPLFGHVEFSDESLLVDSEAVSEISNTGGGLLNRLKENNERNDTY